VQEAQIFKDKGALAVEIAMTPLQQSLLFDYPSSYQYVDEMIATVPLSTYKEMKELPPDALALLKKADDTPSWKGLYAFIETVRSKGSQVALSIPLFEKIRQGEVWRFFTPCLMHGSFLHILFNMIWVWILSKQMEERMKKWKLCMLILIIGVLSNTAQYLISGPYFLGFSGVIVGMAGFIWVRQQKAPWEGYPLQKGTLLFLLFFVLAMCAIELFTFGLQLFSLVHLTPNIANTAHVVGGAVGILLGRFSFFGRGTS
jgi:GlpG protein